MIKPKNFENIQTGDFVPVTPGGHHMIIKQLREQKSNSGKDMLVILVDFADNDSQPKYMSHLFESDIRPDKKWPRAGVIYVVSVDSSGECSRNFKTFITSYERSNNCTVTWSEGPAFAEQFAGKKIGGVFGRVESEYNGERRIRCEHRWFCDDSRVDSVNPPADKLMQDAAPVAAPAVPTFTPVKTEELPW